MTTPAPPRPPEPLYDLADVPDGTSWTDRENLTDILQRDLLGPAHGEDELLDAQPDGLYLVGRIAPAKLSGKGGVTLAEDAEGEAADADVVPVEIADAGRGVPVASVDGEAGEDDGGVEDAPIKRGMMIPASMGLRFQVARDTEAVVVHASWGTYRAETVEDDEPTTPGVRPRRRYRRTPHHHSTTVPVGELTPGETAGYVLEGDVTLRVDVMDVDGTRIVEAALCNDRETPRSIPTDAWLYQTALHVEAAPGTERAVFIPMSDVLTSPECLDRENEMARLQLQYRDRLEFAVGRTCSVDWTLPPRADGDPAPRRAIQVRTTWLPISETPQTAAREIDGALLDMIALAEATPDELRAGLTPIVEEYAAWLDARAVEADALPAHLRTVAVEAVQDARRIAKQLRDGLEYLLADDDAQRCFAFMNRVMADQRIHTQIAGARAADPDLSVESARGNVLAGAHSHHWRTFQLAFVLMQIEALSDPALPRRSELTRARAELLFFPTGGGKTEAYLGLAAYTFATRRLAGVVAGADGPIDGRSGVAVLMRYTLRLLTSQQFQRATALVCAAEMRRREDPGTWGDEPFRIGLWVGTAVSPKRYDEAKEQIENARSGYAYGLTVLQLQRCPWCGTAIDPSRDVHSDDATRRVRVFCGDPYGTCPFAEGGLVGEGLPVLTVDEEIYRLTPAFVIATVDKFARLAREGEAAALFGYVRTFCERHGYVHADQSFCDLKEGGKHPKRGDLPAVVTRTVDRLRPPDLVIQDELHLITGALGTTVGAFEVAIDALTRWTDAEGQDVRPLVVASTATVRNAAKQIGALYGRKVTVFPPQVLDVADTFFSSEVPVTRETPGRRYVGVSTTGVRLTSAEIVVASTLLSAGQLLLDRAVPPERGRPVSTDPYLTLVGYFNATRELAGMARYVADDIQTAVRKRRSGKLFPLRFGTDQGNLNVAELTSRVSSSDITGTLDQMGVAFDPVWDSTAARLRRTEEAKQAKAAGKRPPSGRQERPYDVVLATSMLQVGVDVSRLGLMLVVGQPKNTAEYIQASSRVGRDAKRPGLVVSLGNWARPRDLAHFEQFRHYHETFYSQVEPLSVTPYSYTSIERSIDGVLVSAARVADAVLADGLSPEQSAGRIDQASDRIERLVEALVERARVAAGDDEAAAAVRDKLQNARDHWVKRRAFLASSQGGGRALVYERIPKGRDGDYGPLVLSPESQRANRAASDGPPFVVANSMREVQPEINLLVSPLKDKLMAPELAGEPAWAPQPTKDGDDD